MLLGATGAMWVAGYLNPRAPVSIGFLGDLSGRGADIGQAARDGVILALEECNLAGGVQGRHVELLSRDDRQDPQQAKTAMRELLARNVVAVIGPTSNATAAAVLPLAERDQITLLSPTVGGEGVRGQSGVLFRMYPVAAESADHLARYIVRQRGLKRVCLITNSTNAGYSASFSKAFADSCLGLGVQSGVVPFDPSPGVSLAEVARRAIAQRPECVVVLADAVDSAMICRQLRKLDARLPIALSEWGATHSLIPIGGRAVDDCFFLSTIDRGYTSERFQSFEQQFRRRFGYDSDPAAVNGYDSARMILLAMSQGTDPSQIKLTLMGMRTFEALQGRISFSEWGDVRRELFPVIIRNAEFQATK